MLGIPGIRPQRRTVPYFSASDSLSSASQIYIVKYRCMHLVCEYGFFYNKYSLSAIITTIMAELSQG